MSGTPVHPFSRHHGRTHTHIYIHTFIIMSDTPTHLLSRRNGDSRGRGFARTGKLVRLGWRRGPKGCHSRRHRVVATRLATCVPATQAGPTRVGAGRARTEMAPASTLVKTFITARCKTHMHMCGSATKLSSELPSLRVVRHTITCVILRCEMQNHMYCSGVRRKSHEF